MKNLNFEYLFLKIYEFLSGTAHQTFPNLDHYLSITKVVLIILDIIFCALLIYILWKIDELRSWEKVYWETPVLDEPEHEDLNPNRIKWEQIILKVQSVNQADWKMAVIEADTMLDEAIEMNFPNGENLGERLKNITRADLKSLDDAWEAHKLRNTIAHEAGYELTQHEARQALNRFRVVFDELGTLV